MKPERKQKTTPEESLRHTCGEGMGLELNYNEIRDRLDTAEIARVGKARQAAKAATPAPSAPSPRRAAPAVLLVLAVLILTPALAVGSFLIARTTMEPLPPDETAESVPNGTIPDGNVPQQGITPNAPTVVIPRPIAPDTSREEWSNLFNLSESYTTDLGALLRAEHLDPALTNGTLPAVLTVSDVEEWRQFYGEVHTSGVPDQDLLDTLNGLTWEFFTDSSLLVVITEGRSGSIRYRLDGLHAEPGQKLTLELTAVVPPALTMDIVHWCAVIPVTKDEAALPVELSMREEPAGDGEGSDNIVIPDIPMEPLLWFNFTSYARDGILYGRLEQYPAITDQSFPRAEAVDSLDEWRSLYRGGEADADFLEGLEALDEEFFAEKSLLILYVEESSGSNRHRVDGVAAQDGTLRVTLTVLLPEESTCDMAYWAIMIPLSKEEAALPTEITLRQESADPTGSPLTALDPNLLPQLPEAIFDLDSSYAADNDLYDPNRSLVAEQYTLFLRAAQLPAELAGAEQPTMLWVEELALWQSLFPSLSSHTNESNSVLDISLIGYTSRFFDGHSLLILFTGGRSGSVRYRLDQSKANHVYVRTTLTAGVPDATTMDTAHWCILIPVAKPARGETNRPVYLETQNLPMGSFEEFLTPSPEVHRGLWFRPSSSGSYERDGYLYGRISRNTEKQSWSFPCAEAVTSFEEWQTIYGGYVQVDPSVYPLHQGFREGVNAIDEAFFEQKSLAVVYVNAWSGSHHHRVGEVTAQDGSLHIKISNICSPAGDDDIGYWAILIPIDKELASLPITVEQTEEFPSWEEWEALPENQYWTEWYKE